MKALRLRLGAGGLAADEVDIKPGSMPARAPLVEGNAAEVLAGVLEAEAEPPRRLAPPPDADLVLGTASEAEGTDVRRYGWGRFSLSFAAAASAAAAATAARLEGNGLPFAPVRIAMGGVEGNSLGAGGGTNGGCEAGSTNRSFSRAEGGGMGDR